MAYNDADHEPSVSTSLTMLARARAQDAEAWEKMAEIYGPLVYRWSRQVGLQPDDASDIVQEVFRSLLCSIHGFRKEKPGDSFRGWLWTVTRNKIRDHFRSDRKRPVAEGGSQFQLRLHELPDHYKQEQSEGGQSEITGVYRRALQTIRSSFGEKTWQAFWRMTIHHEPAADIAEDLGLSVWTVYKAKSRVLRRLRTECADLLD